MGSNHQDKHHEDKRQYLPEFFDMGIDVGSTQAERAYRKAGFKYADEKRHPDFEALIGCPGMVRLLSDI